MLNFHKYQGAGNDFIMINNLEGSIKLEPEYIKKICDRHFGIGADGVILIEKSDKADCFMNYYNADGSLAEMCGNGVRCTTKFYLSETNQILNEVNIDTRAGIKTIKVQEDGTYVVNMGLPVFKHPDFPDKDINLYGYPFQFVSMGNPHAITFVNNLNIDIKDIGSKVENNEHFTNKINVEFVQKVNDDHYKVKVWERGSGETLACGTGACAVYSILKPNKEITLEFPGDKLYLSNNGKGEILLRGDAEFVFKGETKH